MKSLSKSRFQKGLQCPKALWLLVHRPELAEPPSEAQQYVFEQGTEVGLLARELFGGGIEIKADYRHPAEALASTAQALAEGASVLYEPAFEFGGAFVRVDILAASGDGRWDLYEVKSSTSVKDVHVSDAAVQAYVVEGSGLGLRTINIVHIDTSYVYPGGPYDPASLFMIEDVTERARELIPSIPGTIESFYEMLGGPEPDVRIGSRCTSPYPCEFMAYCHGFLPSEHAVTDLPRMNDVLLEMLLDAGITSIHDVPVDLALLSPTQRDAVAVVKSGVPHVEREELFRALSRLEPPVYFLDFETVAPALPLWPGTHPYEAVPFQYSLHVRTRDGALEHREYIHDGPDDPRRPLAQHLLADLGESGSIVHYSPYERVVLSGLAKALPDLAPGLESVIARLVDLERIVRKHTRHPASAGRSSIKHVLPAWCPDLSYDGMSVADGQTASARYLRIVKGLADGEEREAILRELTEYCALDSYAMVRLLDELMRQAQQ